MIVKYTTPRGNDIEFVQNGTEFFVNVNGEKWRIKEVGKLYVEIENGKFGHEYKTAKLAISPNHVIKIQQMQAAYKKAIEKEYKDSPAYFSDLMDKRMYGKYSNH